MIERLRKKFIFTASALTVLLMSVLVLIMNLVNYYNIVKDSDAVLDVLTQMRPPVPGTQFPAAPEQIDVDIPFGMSPEIPYESRFFVVTVSKDGEVLQSDLSRIISVDDNSAASYIETALNSRKDRGFIGQFRYSRSSSDDGTRILLFLDCGRKLDTFRSFLLISVTTGLFGCLAVFIALFFTAGRIVAPIAESYEKQKRFISDAQHEIKTPLTIISANVDLLESEEECEELTEIKTQVQRLSELTGNLVLLSRMEESSHPIQKIDLPLSELVSETAASFKAPARSNNLEFVTDIAPDLSISASPENIRKLVSILLENAIKYSPSGGTVKLSLSGKRKTAVLTVENTVTNPMDEKELSRVFDRFYRTDLSRNSETGGHGIGLSVAKAIVEAHEGSISASMKENRFCITVILPKGSSQA